MTATPVRLQLRRRKGFNLQEHSRAVNGLEAVNCTRPSQLGNPYIIGLDGDAKKCVELFRGRTEQFMNQHKKPGFEGWHEAFRKSVADARGKNIACWCGLDKQWCHADVLLEIANRNG